MFDYHNNPVSRSRAESLDLRPLEFSNSFSKFDMAFFINEADEDLTGSVEYRTDLYHASTIEGLIAGYLTLLENIVNNPDRELDSLSTLSDEESRDLIHAFNDDLES
jgi:non-ribosomal peptide synthetase component F